MLQKLEIRTGPYGLLGLGLVSHPGKGAGGLEISTGPYGLLGWNAEFTELLN